MSLHWSVWSEFMFQTSKLVSQDISIVSIFIQFVCPCLCSVFLFDLKVFLGMVAWLPCISDFLRWPSYAVSSFSLIKPQEILWSDLHTSVPGPQHVVATYDYSQTCHVWKVPCLSSEWVWVWYIHAAYTTSIVGQLLFLFVQVWWHSLWAVILIWEHPWLICAKRGWPRDAHSENLNSNFPRGYTPRPPYKCMLYMQNTRQPSKYFSALHA